MTLYEKNLDFFCKKLANMHDALVSEESRCQSKVELATDPLNLIVENEGKRCFIHSAYDVERENLKMFSKVDKDVEKLVVFGFGTGHCLEYINNNFKNLRDLIIVEPDLNVFKAGMNYWDATKIKAESFACIVNKSSEETFKMLWKILSENFREKAGFAYNISYRSLYSGFYEDMMNNLSKYMRYYLINMHTENAFLYQWAENAVKNSKYEAMSLSKLANRFHNMPIVLVSAGPSLNYNMHYLKELKDKAVIMAAGSAIKILDSNGIVPHFRIAFDGGEGERKAFKDVDTEASTLIFSDLLNHHILKEYKGPKLRMVLDVEEIGMYVNKKFHNDEFVFTSGFSVANTALDAAIKLGFKKIIFIGQDLCYTEGVMYASGRCTNEENAMDLSNKKYVRTENASGETVYTSKSFLSMKEGLERRIGLNPEICYINATEKGLKINGTLSKSLKSVIQEDLNDTYDMDSFVNQVLSESKKEHVSNEHDQKEIQCILRTELRDSVNINERRLKRLKKLNKYCENDMGINKLKCELEYVNGMEKELEHIGFYKDAIKPMLSNRMGLIRMSCHSTDRSEKSMVETEVKALTKQAMALDEYMKYLLDLMEEQND